MKEQGETAIGEGKGRKESDCEWTLFMQVNRIHHQRTPPAGI